MTEINTMDIIRLFGRPYTDSEVEALFETLNTANRPSLPEDDEYVFHDWVLVKRKGLELGFEDAAYREALDRSLWGKTKLLLTQIYLYTDFNDIARFDGILPFGLTFADTREQVRQKLAAYETTRHSYRTDTWDIDNLRLNVAYNDQGKSIEKLACWLKSEALSPEEDISFGPPPLEAIISAFGDTLNEKEFLDLWGDAISKESFDDAEEYEEIDLTHDLGVTLNFASEKVPSPLFRSFTLHANRDRESTEWKGEMPLGLGFDDSPETLFRKILVPPARHEDDGLSGYALWHFEDYTLHILYSNLFNRILRVKLIAPGVWKSMEDI